MFGAQGLLMAGLVMLLLLHSRELMEIPYTHGGGIYSRPIKWIILQTLTLWVFRKGKERAALRGGKYAAFIRTAPAEAKWLYQKYIMFQRVD